MHAHGLLFLEKMVHRFCLIRYAWIILFEVSDSTHGIICVDVLFKIGENSKSDNFSNQICTKGILGDSSAIAMDQCPPYEKRLVY